MIRTFAVQDIQAGAFHPPFVAGTEGVAARMMRECVRRDGHPYNANPSDYVLWEIGGFDENTGMLVAGEPRSICNLASLKTMEV